MIFKQKALYFLISLALLVMLGICQYFVVGYFVTIFTSSWSIKLIMVSLMIIFADPVLCKIIMEQLPFKPKNLKNQKIKKVSQHDIKA